uniref:Disease resistance protein winged helix domain-containing protein n=1 Tax=Solanum lycopersicum TaxID=4081 RepID=K4BP65_SOLLC
MGLDEWQKVKDCLWKNIEDDSIEISYILSLSYNDLSIVLKQCFLYFDIFPEDQVVDVENIIWLWMAEGFIPNGEERMEDVAECYLNELIRRSLIQVWEDIDPAYLINLRELTMRNIWNYYSLNNISSLTNLSTLTLFSEEVISFPSLQFVNRCEKLQKLYLNGRIEKLSPFPNSITMIVLRDSVLTEDPMPILGMLPNLRNLELCRAYEGEEITSNDNSFSQLKFIYLGFLSKLERWNLSTNAMPLIKALHIDHCPKLMEIPERMKGVKRI